MNIRALVAGTALTAAGFIGTSAHPASAGCGVNFELHNDSNTGVTVDWDESEVRLKTGWWKDIGSGSTYVPANSTVSQNFTLDFGCNNQRRYRLDATQDGSSRFVYEPSATGYTTSTNLHVDIDF
jgi:hypothetical protein